MASYCIIGRGVRHLTDEKWIFAWLQLKNQDETPILDKGEFKSLSGEDVGPSGERSRMAVYE